MNDRSVSGARTRRPSRRSTWSRAFAGSTRLAAPETEPWIDIEPDRYRAAPGAELPRLYERYLQASDPTGDA